MADVSFAMQAKSDQLNAVDIMGFEPILQIREVHVRAGDQPVSIYYNGDNNKPWKPSKGMIRILSAGWGSESDFWVGKSVQVYMDDSVKYAGKEVGGIRIRAMSDIRKDGIKVVVAKNKQQREKLVITHLSTERPAYPDDKFNQAFDAMAGKITDGAMTLNQVIAKCQQTGDLTAEQLQRLQEITPVDVEHEEGSFTPVEDEPQKKQAAPQQTEQQPEAFEGFE